MYLSRDKFHADSNVSTLESRANNSAVTLQYVQVTFMILTFFGDFITRVKCMTQATLLQFSSIFYKQTMEASNEKEIQPKYTRSIQSTLGQQNKSMNQPVQKNSKRIYKV